MKSILFFGLLCVACGTQDGVLPTDLLATPTPDATPTVEPVLQTKAIQKVATVSQEMTSQLVSMAYNLTTDLPECADEKEGVLALLVPDTMSYRVEGCADILQSANEVVLERDHKKLNLFFMQNYPNIRISA